MYRVQYTSVIGWKTCTFVWVHVSKAGYVGIFKPITDVWCSVIWCTGCNTRLWLADKRALSCESSSVTQVMGFSLASHRDIFHHVFWISSKCFISSHNHENFANLKRTIWKHVIKHGQEKRHFLKDLIPCLHFSENFKNLENLGGVKLKHLLEIQNTSRHVIPPTADCGWPPPIRV